MNRITIAPAATHSAAQGSKRSDGTKQASSILSWHINFQKHPSEIDGKYVDPFKWGDS